MHKDIAIIGGGIIGASIFYQLSRAGFNAVLIEKDHIAAGCTKYSGGLTRSFHLDKTLRAQTHTSLQYYKNFTAETGEQIDFHPCGFLFMSSHVEQPLLSPHYEYLTTEKLHALFGDIFSNIPQQAIYEEAAGYLNAAQVANAWVRAGERAGGLLLEKTAVSHIKQCANTMLLDTHSQTITAKKVVLAAGAATAPILTALQIPHAFYTRHIYCHRFKLPQVPAQHPAFLDDDSALYGRPDHALQTMWMGLPAYTKQDLSKERILRAGQKRFAWVNEAHSIEEIKVEDCYNHQQQTFVHRLPQAPNLLVAAGFGGGGFKIAPWVGAEITRLCKTRSS